MVGSYSEIKLLKEFAEQNNIPIAKDDTINYLTTLIVKHNIKSILEIGTAIGYSTIIMALTNDNLKVVSIERDEERYLEAVKNVKKFGLENRITLIFSDAFDVDLEGKFDLIFIDGAKGQNIRFFTKFSKNLSNEGIIVTDNIHFHGYVFKDEEEIKSKNLRSLVHKIKEYNTFLEEHKEYNTSFLDIGDGLAVTTKKDED